MSDVRPFEEYKEMIQDMRKEEMIKGLYDLSARVTKQENIIKEVREYIEKEQEKDYVICDYDIELTSKDLYNDILKILDKGE